MWSLSPVRAVDGRGYLALTFLLPLLRSSGWSHDASLFAVEQYSRCTEDTIILIGH